MLGIDYGERRIGLAISDMLGILASPLETIISQGVRNNVDYIADIVQTKSIETVVIGLPLNMDGSEGKRVKSTKFFGSVLQKVLNIPVVYSDERLTTFEANQKLKEAGVSLDKREKIIDQVAAQIILQEYLDSALQQNKNQTL
jgi:putative Holliday junction resolvase